MHVYYECCRIRDLGNLTSRSQCNRPNRIIICEVVISIYIHISKLIKCNSILICNFQSLTIFNVKSVNNITIKHCLIKNGCLYNFCFLINQIDEAFDALLECNVRLSTYRIYNIKCPSFLVIDFDSRRWCIRKSCYYCY